DATTGLAQNPYSSNRSRVGGRSPRICGPDGMGWLHSRQPSRDLYNAGGGDWHAFPARLPLDSLKPARLVRGRVRGSAVWAEAKGQGIGGTSQRRMEAFRRVGDSGNGAEAGTHRGIHPRSIDFAI